mgnify:FL=1
MNELLNEMKAAAARHPENQWVSFSEIREAFPSEMHVEPLIIELFYLHSRKKIDLLVEGETISFRVL